jgi:methylated-DNA-[protein]-cysteine S-methyltransferase
MKPQKAYYRSPIGLLEVKQTQAGIASISFVTRGPAESGAVPAELRAAVRQLDEYFRGRRTEFSLALELRGTPFQRRVWRRLQKIPFGRTVSYGELAAAIGRPRAARAVGQANHQNPVSVVIPCHRVIGADGGLAGYGGGLWRKRWLLAHERSSAISARNEIE